MALTGPYAIDYFVEQLESLKKTESEVADLLRESERAHEGIAIGSYPFFREGRVGANFVVRSESMEDAQAVADLLQASMESAGYQVVMGGV